MRMQSRILRNIEFGVYCKASLYVRIKDLYYFLGATISELKPFICAQIVKKKITLFHKSGLGACNWKVFQIIAMDLGGSHESKDP